MGVIRTAFELRMKPEMSARTDYISLFFVCLPRASAKRTQLVGVVRTAFELRMKPEMSARTG